MDEPLYRRIADDLRARISCGELGIGSAVPSEAQLSQRWGASRGTVRQALGTLRAEGLIAGGRGRPAVVRDRQTPQPFDRLVSFTRWAEGHGRCPGQRTLEIARRPVGPEAAQALGLDEGDPVTQLARLRFLDGVATMIERTTFIEPLGRLLFECDLDRRSVYACLAEQGVELTTAHHAFDAVAATDVDAHLLGIAAGAPLLRERRRAHGPTGEPVEYSDDRYRPDLVTFTVQNAPQTPPSLVRTPISGSTVR